jgi:hypothetical protein
MTPFPAPVARQLVQQFHEPVLRLDPGLVGIQLLVERFLADPGVGAPFALLRPEL